MAGTQLMDDKQTECPCCRTCFPVGPSARRALATQNRCIHRCPACRLGVLHPPPSARELKATYDRYYTDANTAIHPLTRESYKRILRVAETRCGKGRLLDVGCGAGQLLRVAAESGWQAEGVEVSQSAANHHRAVGVTARYGSFPDLALEPVYTLITLIEVLEHVPSPSDYLRKASDLLVPSGLLFITTPNFDGLTRRVLGERWRVIAPEHLFYFSRTALRVALENAGLDVMSIRSKNLDLADLRYQLLPPSHRTDHGYSNCQETTSLREQVASRPHLRLVKAGVNLLLGAADLGDTLEGWAYQRQT